MVTRPQRESSATAIAARRVGRTLTAVVLLIGAFVLVAAADPPNAGAAGGTCPGEDGRSVERLYAAYFLREPDLGGWTTGRR